MSGYGRGAPAQPQPLHTFPTAAGRGRGAPRGGHRGSHRGGHNPFVGRGQWNAPVSVADVERSNIAIPHVPTSSHPSESTISGSATGSSAARPLLPHERREPFVPSQPMSVVSEQADRSGMLTNSSAEDAASFYSEPASAFVTSTNDSLPNANPFSPDRVLYRANGLSIMPAVGSETWVVQGQVSLYGLSLGGPIIWEIILDDGRVMRGDLRCCLRPFRHGSEVSIRRAGGQKSLVESTRILFPDTYPAEAFFQTIKHYKGQPESRGPIFSETLHDPREVKRPNPTPSDKGDNAVAAGNVDGEVVNDQTPGTFQADAEVPILSGNASSITTPAQLNRLTQNGPETLIDIGVDDAPPVPSRPRSRASDGLNGLEYHNPLNSEPVQRGNDGAAEVTPHEVITEEQPVDHPEIVSPTLPSDVSALLAFMTHQLDDDAEALMHALLEVDIIEAIPLGENLSQNSLRMLHTLTSKEYDRMIVIYEGLVQFFTWLHIPEQTQKYAALQLALIQLVRDEKFKALQRDEQEMVTTVVYANVRHGHARVVRPAEQMATLRSSARANPPEVHELNQYILNLRHPHRVSARPSTTASHPSTFDRGESNRRAEEAERLEEAKREKERIQRFEEDQRLEEAKRAASACLEDPRAEQLRRGTEQLRRRAEELKQAQKAVNEECGEEQQSAKWPLTEKEENKPMTDEEEKNIRRRLRSELLKAEKMKAEQNKLSPVAQPPVVQPSQPGGVTSRAPLSDSTNIRPSSAASSVGTERPTSSGLSGLGSSRHAPGNRASRSYQMNSSPAFNSGADTINNPRRRPHAAIFSQHNHNPRPLPTQGLRTSQWAGLAIYDTADSAPQPSSRDTWEATWDEGQVDSGNVQNIARQDGDAISHATQVSNGSIQNGSQENNDGTADEALEQHNQSSNVSVSSTISGMTRTFSHLNLRDTPHRK